jgi:tetratricopeptide (TPR) repeat protein
MPHVEFPETLFERVRAGNCILCTGVRFAAAAGLPAWDALFSHMSSKLGADDGTLRQLLAEGKLLTVAGYLKRKLGSESCVGILQELYGGSEAAIPESHQILRELPFRAAITTGYDTLVERAMRANGAGPKVYTYADGAVLRLAEDLRGYVVKAHGDVAHPAPLVLDRLDYKRVIGPNQAYRAFVEDLYRTHTLLILGFHPSDPDFQLFLERLLATFRDAVTDHYAILPGLTQPEQEELYANYRVRVISYDEGGDPVAALTEVLAGLRAEWRKRGAEQPAADDPSLRKEWLRQRLAPVSERIDVVAAEGLELTEARLDAIRKGAADVALAELDEETLCRLGNVSMTIGDIPRAVECYNAALARSPKMAAAHLGLHVASAEAKQYGDAFAHLKRATELDPSLRTVPERYEVTAVIGRGTTGTVYLARDTVAGRDVTVKVLRAAYVREHVSPERWLKETEALEQLDHPNVARVHDVLFDAGRCVLVTEALSGRSLSALLREGGNLAPDRAVEILGQACKGLQHAHERGVLHLDLTPSNIFLRDDGSVALMDFRIGRAHKGRHLTEKGSEGFASPELLAGAGGDARADVYSLGAVLYHVLTGKLAVGSFARLGELNPHARRFEPLVSRALRALPDERPQTVADFAKALASSTEEVALPEREDDLEGWLEVLGYQPDNARGRAAIAKLEAGYREAKSWDPLVTLLLGRVEFETEAETREKLLREVAVIFEREVGDLGKAFAALQAAFRENHASVEIRKELERLASGTGLWNELLQEYTHLVQNLRDPKLACDWWVRMGRLYAHELGHDDYAMASFNQALALDSSRADALAELAEVLRRKGLHKDYARTLAKLADLETDAARRVELLKDLARTYVKDLGSDEESIAAYRRILDIDPASAVAVSALEGLYRKAEMWRELAALLRSRIDVTEVADDLKAYRHTLGELLADKLSLADEAIEQYQQLLASDPDDVRALKALERLYDKTGRNADYLAILDKRIASAQTVDEKVALCRRMAAEWEGQEGGKAKAAEYLEKIVQLKPGDEETLKALARVYWTLGAHARLPEVYGRHIKMTGAPADRAILYAALGKVHEEHLRDDARAIDAFQSLLSVDAESKIALAALARLYQRAGSWGSAAEALQKLATKEESVDKQVEVFHQLGTIQAERLRKDAEAEVSLAAALELKDSHVESLLALAELYRRRKDFGKAARMLREAAQHTANALERVKRLHAAGVTYQDDLHDEQKALEVFEELIAIDPEHVATGERLAAIYERKLTPESTERTLEMLVRKADARDRGRLIDLNLRLGNVARAIGHEERAIAAYRAAYDLDPTNLPVLRSLADLLFKRAENEEAGKLLQALLVHRRDSMPAADIVDVFFKLGEIKVRLGEKKKALNMLEKALDIEPGSARVLERAIALYEEGGDLEAVLRCRKALLKGATDEEARLRIAEEIGDLLHERMKRGSEAIQFYKMVSEAKPDFRRVLNKVMEIYVEQKKWDEAIAAMGKIEDYETDAGHRARLHYTAAVIYRDELKRPDDAAYHLDQALTKDPTHRKAFDALKALYTKQQNWKGLAKAYRLMLQRLPESTPKEEQVKLWHELGEICQEKVGDYKGAIVAFEVAAKLDPKNEQRQDNLALLYTSAGPDAYEKAIVAHHRLLRNNPLRRETYKELRRLYGQMNERDKEWCVSAVLAWLSQASEEETALYHKHRSKQPRRVGRKLSDELWRENLYHAWQSRTLSTVFGTVAAVIAPMAVKPRRSWGLRPQARLEPASDTRPWGRALGYVGQVLDLETSEAYVRGDMKEQVSLVLAGEPGDLTKILFLSPALLESSSDAELVYWLTRGLALLRPEYFLCFVTPSATVLRAVALAALKLVQPETRLGGDVGEILKLVEVLKADLGVAPVERLAALGSELREATADGKVEQWMKGVDLTITRAALLLCDDLETVARLIAVEPIPSMDTKERLRELMLYAVSEPYFKLREQMGMKIQAR